MQHIDNKNQSIYMKFMAVTLIFINIFILVIHSMFFFDHNDHMYSAASMSTGMLYREISYIQAPLIFYFNKAIFHISPLGYHYISLRLASILYLFIAMLIGAFLCIDKWSSRCIFLAFAGTNYYFIRGGLEIGSYSLPLLFLAAATACVWRIKSKALSIFCAALFVGLASSSKLNHLLFFLPLVFFGWIQKSKDQKISGTFGEYYLPIVFGAIIGCMPIIYFLLSSPWAFLLNTLIFHTKFSLPTLGEGFILKQSFNTLYGWFCISGATLIILNLFWIFKLPLNKEKKSLNFSYFLILNTLAAFIAALAPRIVWEQYLVPLTFFLTLAASKYFERFQKNNWLVACLALLAISECEVNHFKNDIIMNLRGTYKIPILARIQEINQILNKYSTQLDPSRHCDPRIFSLTGAFVVDSGFQLSRYAEDGPFWVWVAAHVPQSYLNEKKYELSANILHPENWVREQNINFLLIGLYGHLGPTEQAMEKYALDSSFNKETIEFFGGKEMAFFYNKECMK